MGWFGLEGVFVSFCFVLFVCGEGFCLVGWLVFCLSSQVEGNEDLN